MLFSIGRGETFFVLRRNVPLAVLTVTTLVTLSGPGWHWTTRPMFHWSGGNFSSCRSTRAPVWMPGMSLVHLWRTVSSFKYSCCQRDQKCCLTCWMCCHCERRLTGVSLSSRSGKLVKESPIRKWPGVFWHRDCVLRKLLIPRISPPFHMVCCAPGKVS